MPEISKIYRRVALFEKDGIAAAIGLYSCIDHVHAVCNFDPRAVPDKQFYRRAFETRELALAEFNECVALTRDRGWTVIFNGVPNNAQLS